MAIKNTVETIGDAALTNSIIDRSITELNCNITTRLGDYALRGCTALKSVNFPNVTSVKNGAFYGCTALEKADFSAAVSFTSSVFYECNAMTALILRNTDASCTITGTPFSGSSISRGTGYIYVPRALVDTYKAASGWSTYASQIRAIEDWVEICDPYSWAAVAKAIDNGTYASIYKIGDCVPLDLGTEGEVNMQIAAFDADPLADGSGNSHISFISKELLTTSTAMNSTSTALGGWASTAMRTYLTGTIKPLIPSDVASMIKTVTKYTGSYDTSSNRVTNEATNDDVWIPSYKEVNLSSSWSYESSAPCYSAAFPDKASRIKYEVGTSLASSWWLRSANSTSYFYFVDATGSSSAIYASLSSRVALGFCV